ncbi:hypothetical protein [Bradyrhizobium murdochi]|uniref:hypothetical protein n=1 Tax=Bradyrhizobium murdochi TaxID=1038859 RepID=UPI000426A2F6|nr:hypothetical protein [Bradyrhizobium murdochi]
MAEYRAYLIGSDGQFESSRAFVCDTDENAIVWARQMVGQQPAELWSGTRLVQRLSTPDQRQAISHEVHEGRLVPKDEK